MGLDFSHGDVHWSYSGFRHFRDKLANEIGFPEYAQITTVDDSRYSKIQGEPLLPLLAHSDCDGELSPDECRLVAPRLIEICTRWPDDDFDKKRGLALAAAMTQAASKNEPLEFI